MHSLPSCIVYVCISVKLVWNVLSHFFVLYLHSEIRIDASFFGTQKIVQKRRQDLQHLFAPYFVTPFFGIPSGLYFYHHLIMHHKENNIFPWDISSTEHYQRDKPLSFVTYFLYWITGIWFLLPYHLYKRKQYNMLKNIFVLSFHLLVFINNIIHSQSTSNNLRIFFAIVDHSVFVCLWKLQPTYLH